MQHIYLKQPAAAKPAFTFVRYEQSSKVLSPRDSSVSYVSGVLRVPQ
jgi:predicted class III extradiol MEMO1 family dioxygenase